MDALYTKFKTNLESLLSPIAPSKISVAVSGGADSIALLYLTSIWAAESGCKIVTFTVNHGLRKEAEHEVAYVQHFAESLYIDCHRLDWNSGNNCSNLQARAREARYELMTNKCHELDILVLLTAHHSDDYLENFCIRSRRKGSALGLSGNHIYFTNNVMVIRPLFNIKKAELLQYLLGHKIKWFEDSSNSSEKYERNRVRKSLSEQNSDNIISLRKKIELVEENASQMRPILIEAIAESVSISQSGVAKIDLLVFKAFPFEIRVHIIHHILAIIGQTTNIPRWRSSSQILDLLDSKQDFKKTLNQCILKRSKDVLLVKHEFNRSNPEAFKPRFISRFTHY